MNDIRFDSISQVLELRNFSSEIFADEIDGDGVVVATRDDNIGDLGRGLDEGVKSWLDESVVLVDASLDLSSSFRDISEN